MSSRNETLARVLVGSGRTAIEGPNEEKSSTFVDAEHRIRCPEAGQSRDGEAKRDLGGNEADRPQKKKPNAGKLQLVELPGAYMPGNVGGERSTTAPIPTLKSRGDFDQPAVLMLVLQRLQ
ncbi:hypothetical protein FHS26_004367 [Rhizobium pisi]|uniref:Uncharacterized protein n=1 Tax=Rhizobium pisi TaxID=574561 RepID=A0A7W5G1E3_9HYPH|nr:hypothetical protein [Rhizobium pisi]